MTEKNVKDLVDDLDYGIGAILCNKGTLEALKVEMGLIRGDIDNTDKTDMTALALRMTDITHKIVMIDDLLHFVLDDFNGNFKDVEEIKNKLFGEIVVKDKEEKAWRK